MKMRLSVFSLLFVLLILFLLYKLFLTPGGKAGLPPESALKTIDKAKEISADSSFDMIMRGVNSFKQEKGELPSMLPAMIDRQINGSIADNMFITDEALLSLYKYTDSIPDNKYAFLLDIKSLSVFTFASLIMGAVIPGDSVLTPSAIREMARQSIFTLPIWEGNPFPQRVDMMLHYLSRMNKSDWKEFIKNGVVPKTLISATIPRPISDRQLIHLRRAIVEAAYGER